MDKKSNNSDISPAEKAIMTAGGIFAVVCVILKNFPLFFVGFGVCILTMGISYFRTTKHPFDLPVLLAAMPVIGVVMIGVPILNAAGVMDIDTGKGSIPKFLTAAFLVFGISFLISPAVTRASKLSRCTQPVTAVCVDISTSIARDGMTMYCPVWEYIVNGTTHRYSSGAYSSGDKTQVGDKTEIKVDPNDPDDAFAESKTFNLVLYIVGAAFTAAGTLLLILVH